MPKQRATVFSRIKKTRKFCNQNNTKQETQNNLRFLFFFCRAEAFFRCFRRISLSKKNKLYRAAECVSSIV